MRGETLANLLIGVKDELMLDSDSEVSPGGDAVIKRQIARTQQWLAIRYSWPFLENKQGDVSLAAGAQTGTLPSGIEYGRNVEVACYFGELWNTLDYGISFSHYNNLNPALDQRCDPVTRWMFSQAAAAKFEVWPLPATEVTIRFKGVRTLGALTDDAHTADLDDLLIVQFTAAKLAARMKGADATALLSQAQESLKEYRKNYPSALVSYNTDSPRVPPRDWERPTVATMISP